MNSKEADCVLLAGVWEGKQAALHELVIKYTPLVVRLAKKYKPVSAELEDMVQEGLIGFLNAVKHYNSAHAASFRTFALCCIENKLLSTRKAQNRKNSGQVSWYGLYGELEEGGIAPLHLADPQQIYIDKETYQDIQNNIFAPLSPFERKIFADYLAGKTYKEIAVHLGIPTKSVDNALQRIKRKTQGSGQLK